jgi:hypothetical protein
MASGDGQALSFNVNVRLSAMRKLVTEAQRNGMLFNRRGGEPG